LKDIMMRYKTILVESSDNICTVTLNRPEALNALNSLLISELTTALSEADNDKNVRVIILTGSEKAFAAGADIKEMAEKSFVDMFMTDFFGEEHNVIRKMRKPIIAAVSGYALGGGCELAMMCDFILASETAKFGQPEVNLGVMAGIGGTQRLTQAVGKSKAMEMNLTGRFMDAVEAERAGLVSQIFSLKDFHEEVREVAMKIASKSLLSIMLIKETVNRSFEVPLSEGLLIERRAFHSLFSTEDQLEGMTAFVEKRSPRFRDK
jgi:enoyl-CoA hydratase